MQEQTESIFSLVSLNYSDQKRTLRVLHVDDDLCLMKIAKQILEMEGKFEVDQATSVDDAFKKLEMQNYDAIICDFEMPGKTGLHFLKELREQKNEIAFVMFTGRGREEVAVTALNLGADSYIDKNGSPETVYCELSDTLSKTIERKKTRKLLAESETKHRMLKNRSKEY